jgi:hypothetical protein
MFVESIRSVGVIDSHVEDGLVVIGPFKAVLGILDTIRKKLSSLKILKEQRILLIAGLINGVCKNLMVGRDALDANSEVRFAGGLLVLIQNNLLYGSVAFELTAEDRILLTLLCASTAFAIEM